MVFFNDLALKNLYGVGEREEYGYEYDKEIGNTECYDQGVLKLNFY